MADSVTIEACSWRLSSRCLLRLEEHGEGILTSYELIVGPQESRGVTLLRHFALVSKCEASSGMGVHGLVHIRHDCGARISRFEVPVDRWARYATVRDLKGSLVLMNWIIMM